MQRSEAYEEGKVYPYHKCRYSKGGFKMNYVEDNNVKSVIVSILKQLGTKIIKGEISNLMTISRPAAMCKNISFLECVANDHVYTDFLKEASSSDPLRQMQLICTHIITGLHLNSSIIFTKAPLEPHFGETIQLKKSDGTTFYAEQISENPPIACTLFVGPDNCYRSHLSHQVKVTVNTNLNSMVGKALGSQVFEFKDNSVSANLVEMYIDGLLMGDRVLHYKGKIEVVNKKHNLLAEITFNYSAEGSIAKISNKISSLFGAKKQQNVQERDSVDISIYKISPSAAGNTDEEDLRACISKGSGNWLSFIQFDGKIMWKIDDYNEPWSSESLLLTSDSTFRLDRQLIEKNQIELAQKEKTRLENESKRLQKLRAAAAATKK